MLVCYQLDQVVLLQLEGLVGLIFVNPSDWKFLAADGESKASVRMSEWLQIKELAAAYITWEIKLIPEFCLE